MVIYKINLHYLENPERFEAYTHCTRCNKQLKSFAHCSDFGDDDRTRSVVMQSAIIDMVIHGDQNCRPKEG